MILHIPHASTVIPAALRASFLLSDADLAREIVRMTDMHTDALFRAEGATVVRFPCSRLLVDVERFRDDADEPMAAAGMAKFYARTSEGRPLRGELDADEHAARLALYDAHHAALESAVRAEVEATGSALIVDGHSFPSRPLPCDRSQTPGRPDFCIGTDPLHTDPETVAAVAGELEGAGHSVEVDTPYAGTIVPLRFLGKDPRVRSIMIEVNRRLYMDEASGARGPGYRAVESLLGRVLARVAADGARPSGAAG